MTRARKPLGEKKSFVVAARFTVHEYHLLEEAAEIKQITLAELVEQGALALANAILMPDAEPAPEALSSMASSIARDS